MLTDINDLDLSRQYTYADYLKWAFQERVELLRGYVYRMSPAPNRMHQSISMNLSGIFYQYLKNTTCRAYTAPFDVRLVLRADFRLSKRIRRQAVSDQEVMTVLQPDLCVICDPEKLDDRGCLGAPDLVIEILSPGNTRTEMKEKFSIYEEVGVREYWVVQPEYRNVLVYDRNRRGVFVARTVYSEEDVLVSSAFPNWEIELKEVFRYT
ncbi:MAG: Uma2 family endonuclease [Bacteroidetes Order II. Incertae sedis bacterium]|nr:Uma2 family endonuclease [Bacteroidetes Order II. bacterium]